MKRILIYELIRALKSKPELLRKLKIFALVGVVGLIFVGGLAIWAGVSAVSYVVTNVDQMISTPTAQTRIQEAKTELAKVQVDPLRCWGRVQGLIAVQPWLENDALVNLRNLKESCLGAQSSACEGAECKQDSQETNEGDFSFAANSVSHPV